MLPVLPILALVVGIIHFVKPEWFNVSVAIWMLTYFLVFLVGRL